MHGAQRPDGERMSPSDQRRRLEAEISQLLQEESRLQEVRREKQQQLARLTLTLEGSELLDVDFSSHAQPGGPRTLTVNGLQDGSSGSVSSSTSHSSHAHDNAGLPAGSADVGQGNGPGSLTRNDEELNRSLVQPLKSSLASSVDEFCASIEFGKQHVMVKFDIRVNFMEFLLSVLDSTFVNLTEDDIRRMLCYIDAEGDVTKVQNEEGFEEMKTDYLRSGPWKDLKPLRVVLVQVVLINASSHCTPT